MRRSESDGQVSELRLNCTGAQNGAYTSAASTVAHGARVWL